MVQVFTKYGARPLKVFDGDPYLVENYIACMLQTKNTLKSIKELTRVMIDDLTDLASLECGFTTICKRVMTQIDSHAVGYDNMVSAMESLISDVARACDNSQEFFKSNVFYLKFLATHKDVERLKPLLHWIFEHKEEMIASNNLISSNNGLHVLLILNKIKKYLLPNLEFSDSVWNETERQLLLADEFIPENRYLELFTNDNTLYLDMGSWYDLVLGD